MLVSGCEKEGGHKCCCVYLLALEGEGAVLGGELEELILLGVDAVASDVADLAGWGERQQCLDDGIAADEADELGVD